MEQIPNWYWMVILAGLSGMLGLIFFYLAMLLKEAMLTVREVRYMVIEVHDIIDSVKLIVEKMQRIVDIAGTTVENISSTILKPVAAVSAFFGTVKSVVTGFAGKRSQQAQEIDEVEEQDLETEYDSEE